MVMVAAQGKQRRRYLSSSPSLPRHGGGGRLLLRLLKLGAICLFLQVSCATAAVLLPYSGDGSGDDDTLQPDDGSGDFVGSGEYAFTTETPSAQTDGEGS